VAILLPLAFPVALKLSFDVVRFLSYYVEVGHRHTAKLGAMRLPVNDILFRILLGKRLSDFALIEITTNEKSV
jgi:hypothetical protein